jgi:hypothetical protein
MIGRRRGRAPWGGWRGCARRAAAPPRAPARAPRRCSVGETAPAPAQPAPDRSRPRPAPPRAHPRPHRARRRGRPGLGPQHPTPCRAPPPSLPGGAAFRRCRAHTPGGLRGAHARAARCALAERARRPREQEALPGRVESRDQRACGRRGVLRLLRRQHRALHLRTRLTAWQ